MSKKTLGEAIKTARIKKGMSQRNLGGKLGVSRQQISKYEKGIDRPPDLNIVARVLEMNVNPWLR
jgi:transcriptional regulator with XRE-family HTH domain